MDGKTQLVGIIGQPVGHSLSPRLHNACFAALGLNWAYVPLPVRAGDVAAAVGGLAALGFRGANVTVPHKVAVLAHLEEIDDLAQELGAVNTLVVEPGDGTSHGSKAVIKGYNTDMGGFLAGLHEAGIPSCRGRRVVLGGAGGAARAVLSALIRDGAARITLLNRSAERAEALAAEKRSPAVEIQCGPLNQGALSAACREADVLVNSTSLGMNPQPQGSIWESEEPMPAHLVVYDLVYAPLETRLLAQARRSGAQAVDGLSMLIHQAALAFELWTGVTPPLDVMRQAAQEALSV